MRKRVLFFLLKFHGITFIKHVRVESLGFLKF